MEVQDGQHRGLKVTIVFFQQTLYLKKEYQKMFLGICCSGMLKLEVQTEGLSGTPSEVFLPLSRYESIFL